MACAALKHFHGRQGVCARGEAGTNHDTHVGQLLVGLTAAGLVEVHVDALQLQVRVAVIGASGVHAVLITDDLPELGTNLVATLATCRSLGTPSFLPTG